MAAKRFRVRANFPILGDNAHQQVEVTGGNWVVALGAAARAFKRLPVMRRRRVLALSIVVEQCEGQAITEGQPAIQANLIEEGSNGS